MLEYETMAEQEAIGDRYGGMTSTTTWVEGGRMAILSLPFAAKVDESIKVFSIDATAAEVFLTLDQDGETDLGWLKDQYLGDLNRHGGDKNRTNRIGLSSNDFTKLYYPVIEPCFRHWWESKRGEVRIHDAEPKCACPNHIEALWPLSLAFVTDA